MHRDVELIQRILLAIEGNELEPFLRLGKEQGKWAKCAHQLMILHDVGFITSKNLNDVLGRPSEVLSVRDIRMTWAGHDYLNKIRFQFIEDGDLDFAVDGWPEFKMAEPKEATQEEQSAD